MSIFVTNLENLFGDNGSRLKPNTVPELKHFHLEAGVRPTGITQQNVGGIILDGEGNYGFYDGKFYFLTKIGVAHEGQAGQYSMTVDFGCTFLQKGISVKGICMATNNKRLILDNLDMVGSLVEDPAKLYRVKLRGNDSDGSSELKIYHPSLNYEYFRHYTEADGNKFYSQLVNAKTPTDTTASYPIVIASMQPTGRNGYKEAVYEKVKELIKGIQEGEYFPSRVTALGNAATKYNYCITTEKGSLGQGLGGLGKFKEYVKVTDLDFSGLHDIIPISFINHEGQYSTQDSDKPINLTSDGVSKQYRELVPITRLPGFKKWTDKLSLNVSGYKGGLSQYIKSKGAPSKQLFLDNIPDLNTKLTYSSHESITSKGSLGFQLFDMIRKQHSIYGDSESINSVDVIVGLKELGGSPVENYPDPAPLNDEDKTRNLYNSIGPDAYKSYLSTDGNTSNLGLLPENIKRKFITKNVPLLNTVDKGDIFFNDLNYFGQENDEYDASSKFLNAGKIGSDTPTAKSRVSGIVCMWNPKKGKFGFYNVKNRTMTVPLINDPENDVIGVSFPKDKNADPDTYSNIELEQSDKYPVVYTIIEPISYLGGKALEDVNGKNAFKDNRYYFNLLMKIFEDAALVFTKAVPNELGNSVIGSKTTHITVDDVRAIQNNDQYAYEVIKSLERIYGDQQPVNGMGHYAMSDSTVLNGVGGFYSGIFQYTGIKTPFTGGFRFSFGGRNYCVLWPTYGHMYDETVQRVIRYRNDLRYISKEVNTEASKASDMAENLKKKEVQNSIFSALGLLHKDQKVDQEGHALPLNEPQLFDLVGTRYYLLLDRVKVPHLIFKDNKDIQFVINEELRIADHEIPQSFIDILCQKNILRAYNNDFDLKERLIGNKMDWRFEGEEPKIALRRFSPDLKTSPFEHVILNYQGYKALIDVKLTVPKEGVNGSEYDVIAAEELKLNQQKWAEDYAERKKLNEAEGTRKYQRHQEQRADLALKGFKNINSLIGSAAGYLSSSGVATLAAKAAAQGEQKKADSNGRIRGGNRLGAIDSPATMGFGVGTLGVESAKLHRDIGMECQQIAYDKFALNQEHHGQLEEYKMQMFKLGSVYNAAETNERDVLKMYSDMYNGVGEIYINHYVPSEIQRRLAETMFEQYGVGCIIPEVVVHLQNHMDLGVWQFLELTGFENVHEEPEKAYIDGVFKNGVRIIEWHEERLLEPPKEPLAITGAEKAGEVLKEATNEQRKVLLEAIIGSVDPTEVSELLVERYKSSDSVIETLKSITDNDKDIAHKLLVGKDPKFIMDALSRMGIGMEVVEEAVNRGKATEVARALWKKGDEVKQALADTSKGKMIYADDPDLLSRCYESVDEKKRVEETIKQAKKAVVDAIELINGFLEKGIVTTNKVAETLIKRNSSEAKNAFIQVSGGAVVGKEVVDSVREGFNRSLESQRQKESESLASQKQVYEAKIAELTGSHSKAIDACKSADRTLQLMETNKWLLDRYNQLSGYLGGYTANDGSAVGYILLYTSGGTYYGFWGDHNDQIGKKTGRGFYMGHYYYGSTNFVYVGRDQSDRTADLWKNYGNQMYYGTCSDCEGNLLDDLGRKHSKSVLITNTKLDGSSLRFIIGMGFNSANYIGSFHYLDGSDIKSLGGGYAFIYKDKTGIGKITYHNDKYKTTGDDGLVYKRIDTIDKWKKVLQGDFSGAEPIEIPAS